MPRRARPAPPVPFTVRLSPRLLLQLDRHVDELSRQMQAKLSRNDYVERLCAWSVTQPVKRLVTLDPC